MIDRYKSASGVNNKTLKKATIILTIDSEKQLEKMKEKIGTEVDELIDKLGSEETKEAPYEIIMDKFFLQRINRTPKDRYQIMETNEYPILFAYGEGAEMHQYSISVLNGSEKNLSEEDYNWLDDYELFFKIARLHNLVDFGLNLTIEYSNRIYEGLWFDMQYDENAQLDKITGANFRFFVIEKRKYPKILKGGNF